MFLAAPLAAFTCYLTVPLLIPVLTTYGLPLGYMGDILGGGFILSLASFLVAVAASDTRAPMPSWREPGQDVLRDHRTGGAVRGVHRRPHHRD